MTMIMTMTTELTVVASIVSALRKKTDELKLKSEGSR